MFPLIVTSNEGMHTLARKYRQAPAASSQTKFSTSLVQPFEYCLPPIVAHFCKLIWVNQSEELLLNSLIPSIVSEFWLNTRRRFLCLYFFKIVTNNCSKLWRNFVGHLTSRAVRIKVWYSEGVNDLAIHITSNSTCTTCNTFERGRKLNSGWKSSWCKRKSRETLLTLCRRNRIIFNQFSPHN